MLARRIEAEGDKSVITLGRLALKHAKMFDMASLALHEIDLKPGLLKAMERKAQQRGQTPSEYVRWLIERDVLADKSFDEMLAPVRADFRKSGITETELDKIVEQARRCPDASGTKTNPPSSK